MRNGVFSYTGRKISWHQCAPPNNSSQIPPHLKKVDWSKKDQVTYGQCEIKVTYAGHQEMLPCIFGNLYDYDRKLSFRTEVRSYNNFQKSNLVYSFQIYLTDKVSSLSLSFSLSLSLSLSFSLSLFLSLKNEQFIFNALQSSNRCLIYEVVLHKIIHDRI